MDKKPATKLLAIFVLVTFLFPTEAIAASNPKSGAKCSKFGLVKEFQNKKFTCVKIQKKLVWNKGTFVIKNALENPLSELIPEVISTNKNEVTQKYLPSGCHARVSATLQLKEGSNWKDIGEADGWELIKSCPNTNPYQPFKTITLQSGSIVRWRVYSPGNWEWFSSEETVIPVFKPSNVCQLLGQDGNTNMNMGFPKRSNRLSSKGVIRAIVVGVDFNDVVGVEKPASEFREMTDGMQSFYKKMSANQVSFEFTFTDNFIRMPFESTKYDLGKWNGGDSYGYINALIAGSDAEVDFNRYDVAYFLSPRIIPWASIAYGPAFPIDLQTQDGVIKNSTFSGADAYQNFPGAGWKWISHETGHLFGLHDLYTFQPKEATYGSWDLMSLNWSKAAIELNAWNRYIQGWLSDSEVNCIDKRDIRPTEITISPIERINKLIKAVTIKINDTKILVVESRRNEGLDILSPLQAGTLVYTVDMTVMSGQGGWNTQRRPGSTATDFTDAALKVGDKIIVEGVTIEVLSQDSTGDRIRVS